MLPVFEGNCNIVLPAILTCAFGVVKQQQQDQSLIILGVLFLYCCKFAGNYAFYLAVAAVVFTLPNVVPELTDFFTGEGSQ